jgi:hypothetical protein
MQDFLQDHNIGGRRRDDLNQPVQVVNVIRVAPSVNVVRENPHAFALFMCQQML